MMPMGPAIETVDLVKRYGRTTALAGLTMRVERGEVFGFLGPNGAGKTTSIKLFLGLARATSGTGTLLGAPLGDREGRRRVGYLPELFRYQPWLRAREVLALHCELAGVAAADRATEIVSALETVGLADRAEDLVGTFSKGMQQRLGLGSALLGRPELVLLDEPTSALDPVGRADVRRIIREARDRGTTVFLNSHLLSEVELVCDRVARAGLARFGPMTDDGDWLAVNPISAEQIPELVAAIVAAGGSVHAVEPGRASLEERFLGLVDVGRAG
jgi:ABC-2 type transport system ATP-binding protein